MTLAPDPIHTDAAPLPQHLPAADQQRLCVMGQQLTIRMTSAQTQGACMVFDDIAEPGMGVPVHVHDHEDELFIVRRGTVRFVVDGRQVIAGPGDSVFGPRGVPHGWEVIGDEIAEATIIITPGNLEAMFQDLGAVVGLDFPAIVAICGRHGVRFA